MRSVRLPMRLLLNIDFFFVKNKYRTCGGTFFHRKKVRKKIVDFWYPVPYLYRKEKTSTINDFGINGWPLSYSFVDPDPIYFTGSR